MAGSGRSGWDREHVFFEVETSHVTTDGSSPLRDDAPLGVSDAARIARRSVRTIRRAYQSGRLLAHRDGNGRGVTIRYGDLRAWLFAEVVTLASPPTPERAGRADVRRPGAGPRGSSNLELLNVARQRRGRGARSSGAGRRAEGPAGPLTA